ncbi:MAG: histidine kinase [Flavobacteriales bacterium]|nr:histidine kinase [Flavobacteriales bacterium]
MLKWFVLLLSCIPFYTQSCQVYLDSIDSYYYTKEDRIYGWCVEGLACAQNNNDSNLQMMFLGVMAGSVSDIDTSILLLNQTLELAIKLKDFSRINRIYGNLGYYYSLKGDDQKSLELYQKQIENARVNEDFVGEAKAYANQSFVYIEAFGDTAKAISLISKGIECANKDTNQINRGRRIDVLAQMHANLGLLYMETDRDEALRQFYKSVYYGNEIDHELYLSTAYFNLAEMFPKKSDSSQYYARMSLQSAQKTNNLRALAVAWGAIARSGTTMGLEPNQIIDSLEKYLPIHDLWQQTKLMAILIEKYKGIENWRKALSWTEQLNVIEDSLFTLEKIKNLKDVEEKYLNQKVISENLALEKKEAEQSNTILMLFVAILIVSILAIVFIIRARLKRQKLEREKANMKIALKELEFNALNTQINTHFLFNVVDIVRKYINDHQIELAQQYLISISKLIRTTLDNGSNSIVSLEDEINCLKLYLEVCNILYNNNLNFNFDVDTSLDVERIGIPPMLLQPYLENSIIHGLKTIEQPKLEVQFRSNEDKVLCKILDNGVGFDPAKAKQKLKETPHGTDITQQRLVLNNAEFGHPGEVQMNNRHEAQGAEVQFSICYTDLY